LEKSLVISKGLGNFLTMQNAPFDMIHFFMSKGFVGKRVAELTVGQPIANMPLIIEQKAGDDIRPAYLEKYLSQII